MLKNLGIEKNQLSPSGSHAFARVISVALVFAFFSACAADPQASKAKSTTTGSAPKTTASQQIEETSNASGTHISFHYSDFFTLTHPRTDTSCAGDLKHYYRAFDYQAQSGTTDPGSVTGYVAAIGPTGARPFSTDVADSTMTARPLFIKNIAVDITDANSPITSNQAFACSLGSSSSVPPPSNCATFDYGAVGGIPSTLGGTLVMVGGINGTNYGIFSPDGSDSSVAPRGHSLSCGPSRNTTWSVATSCAASMFALGIDTLPPSAALGSGGLAPGLTEVPSESISTWGNLSSATGYSGPLGATGAAVSYTKELQRILLFGGAAPVTEAPSLGADNSDTWIYDLKEQKWTKLQTLPSDSSLAIMQDSSSPTVHYQLSKSAGGRALHGYAALPLVSIANMSVDGLVGTAAGKAVADTTDRIGIVGGYTAVTEEAYTTRKFNPTFGPEYVDLYTTTGHGTIVATTEPVQYLDSFHTQLMNNNRDGVAATANQSQFKATYSDAAIAATENFGMTSLISGTAGNLAGYLLSAGGYPTSINTNITPSVANAGGRMYFSGRRSDTISGAGNFAAVPNAPPNTSGEAKRQTELDWDEFTEGGGKTVPWYTGVNLVQGFDLDTNEVVYLGGSNCRRYLTDASASGCTYANPGRYFRMGAGPWAADTVIPAEVALGGVASPAYAGMAAARGVDSADNVVVVAWGGTNSAGESKNNTIYVLYDNGGVPTWIAATNANSAPAALTNSSLVYSHVTKKFYLFGGYQGTKDSNGIVTPKHVKDTWELSITRSAGPVYSGTWKKLNTSGGLTCYPADCPVARRSHRMVEVNYNNTDPTEEPVCTASTAPCSFGIFMEGGTADGYEFLGDRWMFDPTANEGRGHWQKVDGFPPRHAAAMASVSFKVNNQANAVHRSVLFGGQSGLHSPATATSSNFFIPPTFGDTYFYDFASNSWLRPKLLGRGYSAANVDVLLASLSEFEKRQAYLITGGAIKRQRTTTTTVADSSIAELSPPPLAGAIMVTRNFSGPLLNATTPVSELRIPELFLIGGRKKDGTYNTINGVYKFCTGSTGERIPSGATDDASCDAYNSDNPTDNPSSPSPSTDAIGRWIRKTPVNPDPAAVAGVGYDVTTSAVASYMGAAVYDPMQDKIVLFGGLSSTTAVTNTTGRTAGSTIYEYTPPSKVDTANDYEYSGYWRAMPMCTGYSGYNSTLVPTGRYGHSMGYDLLNRQVVVVGGYNASGTQLTQTLTSRGTTYNIPEVWTGQKVYQAGVVNSTDSTNIPIVGNTFPCYYWKKKTVFGNSPEIADQAPPTSGISHAASIFIPSTGYNTGFYSMFDDACPKAGPLAISDPEISKLLAGGVYIDLDRTALKTNENLLLNLTYIPLGPSNTKPNGNAYKNNETAVIKVHLMKTGESLGTLRSTLQPRHLTYAPTDDTSAYIVDTISVLAPPTGAVRQDQIILPISVDPKIDRIRIERYSGSAILIDAGVYRMGAK